MLSTGVVGDSPINTAATCNQSMDLCFITQNPCLQNTIILCSAKSLLCDLDRVALIHLFKWLEREDTAAVCKHSGAAGNTH